MSQETKHIQMIGRVSRLPKPALIKLNFLEGFNMSQETKHTPLPWKQAENGSKYIRADYWLDARCRGEKNIANTSAVDVSAKEAAANAEFIVRACNEHYADKAKIREQEELIGELVAALKLTWAYDAPYKEGRAIFEAAGYDYSNKFDYSISQFIKDKREEAINKATEGR